LPSRAANQWSSCDAGTVGIGLSKRDAGLDEMQRFYLPQLDGLRFVAFFLVLISHLPPPDPYFAGTALHKPISTIAMFGWIGVDLFLVLSSFLIISLLCVEKDEFGSVGVGRFYIRRALRIWPVYYPYLAFAFWLRWDAPSLVSNHLLPFSVFLGNFSYFYFTTTASGYFSHLWTISLEEQFYLFAPLIVSLLFVRIRIVAAIAIGLILISYTFRYYVAVNEVKYPAIWLLPICRFDPFVVGGVLAWLYRYKKGWFASRAISVACLGISLALLVVVMSFPNISLSRHAVWQIGAVDVAFGLLVASALCSGSILDRVFSWGWLPFFGKISFGLYVYHMVVVFALRGTLREGVGGGSVWIGGVLLALILTVAIASVSYVFYERPILKFKRRFEAVPSRPA
jgi:peptidoglycan/LPS O-acetylase OafA/YrhL